MPRRLRQAVGRTYARVRRLILWEEALQDSLVPLRRAAALAEIHRIRAGPSNADKLFQWGAGYRSQNDEDGILMEILRRIGIGHGRFLEIGAGDGTENNTIHLLMQGWSGTWVEGDPARATAAKAHWAGVVAQGRLQVIQRFLDLSNLDDLLSTGPLDLLSVDVDGNDYHLVERLMPLAARVVVVEYNATLGPYVDWVMPYDARHRWDGSDRFGASLAAWARLLGTSGYRLVGCGIGGVNAFFVRGDLAGPFGAPRAVEAHYQPLHTELAMAWRHGFAPRIESRAADHGFRDVARRDGPGTEDRP